jgi:Protein of unknown function (DUF2971)
MTLTTGRRQSGRASETRVGAIDPAFVDCFVSTTSRCCGRSGYFCSLPAGMPTPGCGWPCIRPGAEPWSAYCRSDLRGGLHETEAIACSSSTDMPTPPSGSAATARRGHYAFVQSPAEPSDRARKSARPTTLFHYTDASGLLGILTSRTLWATDFRFLNDEQEATYARELFVSALRQLPNPALDPAHPLADYAEGFGEVFDGYRRMVEADLGSSPFPVYVACFCEAGDLLSQWRGYGADHGYAIEVDTDALERTVAVLVESTQGSYPEQDIMSGVAQVRYGPDAATDVVTSAMREVSGDANLGHPGAHASVMAGSLTTMLAQIKHPGFAEEREWRAILGHSDDVKFRPTTVAIAPYLKIPFDYELVVSVRVGPGRHAAVRRAGVIRLLESLDFGSQLAPVLTSDVPLRS